MGIPPFPNSLQRLEILYMSNVSRGSGSEEKKRTLPKEKPRASRSRVLVGHLMQLAREHGGSAEEHAHVRFGMFISDARKNAIPIRPAKVRRCPQRGYRVLIGADVLYDDVGHVVFFDLRRQVDVDLNPILQVLLFDCVQE